MSKKLIIGIGLILLSILYGLQSAGMIQEDTVKYFLNYQVILVLLGLFIGIIKKKTSGFIIVGVGVYLYVQEFFERFTKVGVTLALLIVGIALLVIGVLDMKKKKEVGKNTNSFGSVNTAKTKEETNSEEKKEEE